MKKQIGHLVMISLKFFFDLDPSIYGHLLIAGIVIAGLAKLLIYNVTDNVRVGLVTVKEDAIAIKEEMGQCKERWENSQLREMLTNNVRNMKSTILDNDLRNWRLK